MKNDIFENFKKSKMIPKTPKSQKIKNSKSHIWKPQIKKSSVNMLKLELKNIKNDTVKNFKK